MKGGGMKDVAAVQLLNTRLGFDHKKSFDKFT